MIVVKDFIARIRGKLFVIKCKILRKNIYIDDGIKIYKKLKIGGKGKVIIGKNCLVDGIKGDDSQIVCIETLNENALINIGCNAHLYAARINARFNISIGDDVLIEEAGIIDTDFHSIDRNRELPTDENEKNCRVIIGNRVCIGARSVITKGSTIEDDVIVAPGAIVTKTIKSGQIVIGNPAKILDHSTS